MASKLVCSLPAPREGAGLAPGWFSVNVPQKDTRRKKRTRMVLCSASPTEAPFGTLPGAQLLAPP